jgi:hypothetical protein
MQPQPPSAGPERRRWPRRALGDRGSNPLVATLGVLGHCALVRDLSLGGICLLTAHPPPPGTVVPVWLCRPAGPSPMLLVTVRHVVAEPNALYRVGAALLDEDSVEIARSLLG